jgi:capreomycidine synthase
VTVEFRSAPLEEWMRKYYHSARYDLGSSGVQAYSLAELRGMLGISQDSLDAVSFADSTSYGSEALRAAVAGRWGNGRPDRVMVTHGSSEAIYLVMSTLLDSGDVIVAQEPIYHSLTSTAQTMGCRIRPWVMREERGFRPDLDDLAPLLKPRPRLLVVNMPHNPTGRSLCAAEATEMVAMAARAGTYLVFDAALSELTYDSPPLPDPSIEYDRAISVGSFSKAYGLPGLRFGWCIADPAVLSAMVPLRDRITLSLSPLVEFLALQVTRRAGEVLGPRLCQARQNLGLLRDWAGRNADVVQMTWPDGGVTVFPRFTGIEDADTLCDHLGRDSGVLLVPGSCFGHPSRVRLGFGDSPRSFEAGLEILARAIRNPAG